MPFERLRVAKKRSKSQINRLLSELRYYRELKTETEELFIDYDLELNLVLEDITSIVEPESSSLESENSNETSLAPASENLEDINLDAEDCSYSTSDSEENAQEKTESQSSKAPVWMKSLFKKIAIETHPDKVQNRNDLSEFEKNERSVLYKKASNALNSLEEMKLLEVGYSLGILPDLSEHEQKNIILSAINKEKNSISSSHQLVAWIWGENFGNIDVRSNLLIYVRKNLGLPEVSLDIIREYIVAFENDEDLSDFKQKYVVKDHENNSKKSYRKVGERPAPSFVKSRK